MSVTEFFTYLHESETTRELALELADAFRCEARAPEEERVLAHA